jgi:hypothetical protein
LGETEGVGVDGNLLCSLSFLLLESPFGPRLLPLWPVRGLSHVCGLDQVETSIAGLSALWFVQICLLFRQTFTELRNAQFVPIPYDALNPIPPTSCYLKHYYNDANHSYFQQLEEGAR